LAWDWFWECRECFELFAGFVPNYYTGYSLMSNIDVVDFAKKEAMGALYCDHHGFWGNPALRRFGPKLHIKGG